MIALIVPTFKPLSDTILIEPYEEKKSGLVIPDAEEKTQKGKVVSVGPGKPMQFGFVATTIKPGDVIVYRAFAAEPTIIEGKKFICVAEAEVLGVVKN